MTEEQAEKKPRNWTKLVLVLSLAANFIVAGIVLGAVFGDKKPGRGDAPLIGGIRPFVAALPDDQRQEMRKRLFRNREVLRDGRDNLRDTSRAIRAAIAAEPYEADALQQAFAAQRVAFDRMAMGGHEALVQVLGSMTAEERAAFLERLRFDHKRPHKKDGRP